MADGGKSEDKKSEENTEFQNFQRLLKRTLAVPKDEVNKRRNEYEQAKKRRKKNEN